MGIELDERDEAVVEIGFREQFPTIHRFGTDDFGTDDENIQKATFIEKSEIEGDR